MIELDPRPDLISDSEKWTTFLVLANLKNKELASILHGFRCCGLRLHKGSECWALRPDFDPENSKWLTKGEYVKDRDKWLTTYQQEIIKLLDMLGGAAA
jgi:hypothetical protein